MAPHSTETIATTHGSPRCGLSITELCSCPCCLVVTRVLHVQKLSHRLASTVFGVGWDEVVWNGIVWGGLGWERTGFGCSLLTGTVFGVGWHRLVSSTQ